ncbi:MAG: kynureninase [Bacteroidales bacterium]|jgi:kynureninase|nr:kynureninase [Bacteroidales bacterium]
MRENFKLGVEFAKEMDAKDELRSFKNRFYLGDGELYLDGNSLGACSKDAEEALLNMLEIWKKEKILMWNIEDGKYFKYPQFIGGLFAEMVNADKNELTCTNSVTINIHQALATFYKPSGERYKILVDDLNFPTDIHAAKSQVKLHGYDVEDAIKVVKSRDGKIIEEDDILEALTDEVSLALLPSLLYRSAQLLDMEIVTRAAHEKDIIIGWDLSHSIGSVPHDFKVIDPDFAIWCTYKHISGGPGSNAILYINRKHFGTEPGLAGWHGNKKETLFQLSHIHSPEVDADAWLTGTPNMLSMAPLEGVMKIFNEAGIENIRKKSLLLTDYLIFLIEKRLAKYGFVNGTPVEHNRRGGHIALEHEEAYRICLALKDRNVIPDFREPNVIRLAPVALYVSFEDIHKVIDIIEEIAREKAYEKFPNIRTLVV